MIKYKVSFRKRIILMLFAVIIIAVILCGCETDLISPPTLALPTQKPTSAASDVVISHPTSTPDAGEEIYFNDANLENVVRNLIGKNIGAITRADVADIKELSARVRGITKIDGLQYFTGLEILDLYGNRISDISPIANLSSLKKLDLGKNYNILTAGTSNLDGLDVSHLKGLVLLEELDLSDNMLTDLNGIGSLPNLKKLILKKNRINDISLLSGLKNLKYIDISQNYGLNSDKTERGISDLSPLYGIETLETLIAGYNLITDLQGIENMAGLSYIDLTDNFVISVEPLANMNKLETLIMHCNALTSIDAFENNKTIKTLDVSLNMIMDFKVILKMESLINLKWEQNNIQDYSVIEEFEAIKNGKCKNS